MATSANQQQGGIYLPPKQTIGNQAIKPVTTHHANATIATTEGSSQPLDYLSGRGLIGDINLSAPTGSFTQNQYQSVTGDARANAPTANVPTIDWTPKDFVDHGYSAEQTKEKYSYDPRKESMVQHQLTGLLDPNSDIMRRAIANANAYSAGRGLQSSSIAAGAAKGAMIDRALPIAQQDANTNMQADHTGWNHSFNAEQANADRRQQLTAINAQGSVSNQLQNNQMSFQQASQQAQMAMQAEMQQLQYLQSLGLLDAQGAQRMQELNAQQRFQFEQSGLDREFAANQFNANAGLQIGLQDMQGFQNWNQQQSQQGWQSGENTLTREQQRWLQENSQSWQSSENNTNRNWQSGENQLTREQQRELQELSQAWQSGENTLTREQQQRLQELSQAWQSNENTVNRNWQSSENTTGRDFQREMQELQNQQQLGLLDAQGQQQLQQMERQSQLTQERDRVLQQFNDMNMDKSFLQNLQMAQVQFEQQDAMFTRQINAQMGAEYRNAVTSAYNNYLNNVANIMSDPNSSAAEKQAGAAMMERMFQQQRNQMQAIYGFSGSQPDTSAQPPREDGTGGNPTNPNPGDWRGTNPLDNGLGGGLLSNVGAGGGIPQTTPETNLRVNPGSGGLLGLNDTRIDMAIR